MPNAPEGTPRKRISLIKKPCTPESDTENGVCDNGGAKMSSIQDSIRNSAEDVVNGETAPARKRIIIEARPHNPNPSEERAPTIKVTKRTNPDQPTIKVTRRINPDQPTIKVTRRTNPDQPTIKVTRRPKPDEE